MNLKEIYTKKAVPALMKEFAYRNVMAVPRLEKAVVNVGVGRMRDEKEQSEVEKYLARHPGLSNGDRGALESCTRAIVNKILHEPIILMKTEEPKEGSPKYSEILRKLFRLESE